MPDTRPDTEALREAAAAAVAGLPCVIRLEPTFSNALRQLHDATTARINTGQRATYSAADGIRLTRRGDTVDIHVDLTVERTQPADQTALKAQHALRATVQDHQLLPGQITVTVLKLQA